MEKLGQAKHVQDYGGNYPANYHSDYDNYSQRPPDRPTPPQPTIAQNPNRRNGSGPDNRDSVLRKFPHTAMVVEMHQKQYPTEALRKTLSSMVVSLVT